MMRENVHLLKRVATTNHHSHNHKDIYLLKRVTTTNHNNHKDI